MVLLFRTEKNKNLETNDYIEISFDIQINLDILSNVYSLTENLDIKLKLANLFIPRNTKNDDQDIDFSRLKRQSRLQENNVGLMDIIVNRYNIPKYIPKLARCKIKIFNYKFNSSNKRNCTIMEYHKKGSYQGCQIIGFFGTTGDFVYFSEVDRTPYILNTDLYVPHYSITTINDEKSYYNVELVNKDASFNLYKLGYAIQEIIEQNEDGFLSSRFIPGPNPLEDEYILIANTTIPIYSIDFETIDEHNLLKFKDYIEFHFMLEKSKRTYLLDYIIKNYILVDNSNNKLEVNNVKINSKGNTTNIVRGLTTDNVRTFNDLKTLIFDIQKLLKDNSLQLQNGGRLRLKKKSLKKNRSLKKHRSLKKTKSLKHKN